MILTKNLNFNYNNEVSLHFPDFQCEKGDNLLILGPSGCGKTTLLHLLAGLLTPQSGEIRINSTKFSALTQTKKDKFRGKNIGVVFQNHHFIKSINAIENLKLAQYFAGEKPDEKGIHRICENLNIAHLLNKYPGKMSQGEKQRLSIARSIINRPSLILADEPTSSLDDFNTEEVIKLLTTQSRILNAALIIVTHDQRLKKTFKQYLAL